MSNMEILRFKLPPTGEVFTVTYAQRAFDAWFTENISSAKTLFRMRNENGLEFWENEDQGGMSDAVGKIVFVEEK